MMPSDLHPAWALADHLTPHLVDDDRMAIYVGLGCGNEWDAITHMLNVIVRERITVPEALVCQIAGWLDGYAGTADEPTIRELLDQLQRRKRPETLQRPNATPHHRTADQGDVGVGIVDHG